MTFTHLVALLLEFPLLTLKFDALRARYTLLLCNHCVFGMGGSVMPGAGHGTAAVKGRQRRHHLPAGGFKRVQTEERLRTC